MKLTQYYTIILGILLMVWSCKTATEEKPNLEGDLYYTTWLAFGSFYAKDTLYQNYLHYKDSIGIEELRKEDPILIPQIELLEKHNLVKSPFIYLKTDKDSTYTIYMTPKDYEPITQYTYQDLIDNKEKIRLQLIIEPLTDKFKICKKVVSIEKIKGETLKQQRKFKIEDYR